MLYVVQILNALQCTKNNKITVGDYTFVALKKQYLYVLPLILDLLLTV